MRGGNLEEWDYISLVLCMESERGVRLQTDEGCVCLLCSSVG